MRNLSGSPWKCVSRWRRTPIRQYIFLAGSRIQSELWNRHTDLVVFWKGRVSEPLTSLSRSWIPVSCLSLQYKHTFPQIRRLGYQTTQDITEWKPKGHGSMYEPKLRRHALATQFTPVPMIVCYFVFYSNPCESSLSAHHCCDFIGW